MPADRTPVALFQPALSARTVQRLVALAAPHRIGMDPLKAARTAVVAVGFSLRCVG